jgi:5-methylcytosine-specific restriction endonuclease McrA
MSLMLKPVLVLNAAYEPLSIVRARRALTLVTKGVAVVELATNQRIYRTMYLPSVVRLREYRHLPIRLQVVSRKNILARDGNRCMYCGQKFQPDVLTLDHVVPKSRGGRGSWENLVACCQRDNHRKGDRTPEEAGMKLIHRPLPQTVHTQKQILRSIASEVKEWSKYLWHDSQGDKRYAFS